MALLAGNVEGRFLMRVLAIAQRLAQLAGKGAAARRRGFAIFRQYDGEPIGHGSIVSGGAGIRDLCQLATQRQAGCALVGVEFGQYDGVILRIDHHRDPVMVFGAGTRHRRAADIDVLDSLCEAGAFGDRRLEGIEIADDKIDAFDAMRLHGFGVIRLVAQSQ